MVVFCKEHYWQGNEARGGSDSAALPFCRAISGRPSMQLSSPEPGVAVSSMGLGPYNFQELLWCPNKYSMIQPPLTG
jgi:hypothetical protein